MHTRTLWPTLPGLEAVSAHLSHSTHGPPAKRPGLRLHEALWHRDSWAKDIAAFFYNVPLLRHPRPLALQMGNLNLTLIPVDRNYGLQAARHCVLGRHIHGDCLMAPYPALFMNGSALIADPLLRQAFGRRACPSDPHRTVRVRSGSSRLRSPVSRPFPHPPPWLWGRGGRGDDEPS